MRFLLRKFATAKEIYVASFKILSFAGYFLFAAFTTVFFTSLKQLASKKKLQTTLKPILKKLQMQEMK